MVDDVWIRWIKACCIPGNNNQNLTLLTYHKSTYTGLLLNFNSFTSFSYNLSLIKCLIDRSFKICNYWNSFLNDIENIKFNQIKNAYLPFLTDKVFKKNLDYKFSINQNHLKDKSDVHYYKLPYISNLSHHIKIKLLKLCKKFCKEKFHIKLVFNSLKIKYSFSYKDSIPNDLKHFLVYKFPCASCSFSYIGEACRHFKALSPSHYIASVFLAPFCLCLFFFCCFLHFSFIYCFHYLYPNYLHLLLS